VTNVMVNKVLFSGTSVSGVNISFYASSPSAAGVGSCTIHTNKVVVSAGAYGTPKLLKLSGVGPAAELNQLHIPVVSDVSSVGVGLSDHFTLFHVYSNYKDNLVGPDFPDAIAVAEYNTQDSPSAENEFTYQTSKAGPGGVVLTLQRTNLHARGTVTLASANPADPPVVDPNYFGDESDKIAAGVALFKLRQVAALLNLTSSPLNPDPCTGSDCSTPVATFNTYIAQGAYFAGLHFTATVALCDSVNPKTLRVPGTSGLYVLDASIMPKSPAAPSMASVYAVAERGIDLINSNMHTDAAGQIIEELLGWAYCLLEDVL